MNSGKKILPRVGQWFSKLYYQIVCFFIGHTQTNVCTRCGKLVNLKGKPKQTFEERINGYFARRKELKKAGEEYKGSIKLKTGLIKYELNLATNELRRLKYEAIEALPDGKKRKLKAKYDPCCVYLDAMNDNVAIRKANTYLYGVKKGVRITHVSNAEEFENTVTV